MEFSKLSFQDKELAILRDAIDKNEKIQGKQTLDNPEIKRIIEIVEQFLMKKKRLCYGGTAINNILPLEDQFYDKAIEFPDYDFFSPSPLKDAKELADIYIKEGFSQVQASAGTHGGTFKVFVNFIPVADITELVPELYKNIEKDALVMNGIYYSPPNFLRMLAYLELSRPLGDISRWEKVLKRINLLNTNYPLRGLNCESIDIQRLYKADKLIDEHEQNLFKTTRKTLINLGVVFFGALASKLILKYLPMYHYEKIPNVPDFDVLSLKPFETATILKDRLKDAGFKQIKIFKKKPIGELIGEHYEIRVEQETVVIIYKPTGCLSFNIVRNKGEKIRIATIDTLLTLYLAFLYTDRPYFDDRRILCISEFMFKVQQQNRLKQKGLLKRFTINCYGKQKTLTDIRAEKSEKYEELLPYKGTEKWDRSFLRYPAREKPNNRERSNTKKRKRSNTKKIKHRKTRKNMFGV